MSSLIVEVCRVAEVLPHPNADRMCICRVKGWEVCAGRNPDTQQNQFAPGDLAVYIPPDAVLPTALSDRIGVTKYLSSPGKRGDGSRAIGGRVRVARLRGFPSYGLIFRPEDPTWPEGTDVAAHHGITKWEPPPVPADGDAERPHPAFHKYTDIENIRNFPDWFAVGEEVILTEKIHGKNARVGLIRQTSEGDSSVWTFAAGSHDVRRKELATLRKKRTNPETGAEETFTVQKRSQFWEVLDQPGVKELLQAVAVRGTDTESASRKGPPNEAEPRHNVVLFGEIFGSGVQDMAYGFMGGHWGFRAFDLAVDGVYVDFEVKTALFKEFGVEQVPILYRGPFSWEVVQQFAEGPTTAAVGSVFGFGEREGVVVTPVKERLVADAKNMFHRLILKAINFKYLERKGGTEYH